MYDPDNGHSVLLNDSAMAAFRPTTLGAMINDLLEVGVNASATELYEYLLTLEPTVDAINRIRKAATK
jgi:hypothetical protein